MTRKGKKPEELKVTWEQVGTKEQSEEAIRHVFTMILQTMDEQSDTDSATEPAI